MLAGIQPVVFREAIPKELHVVLSRATFRPSDIKAISPHIGVLDRARVIFSFTSSHFGLALAPGLKRRY
jgi:hypothetical protein